MRGLEVLAQLVLSDESARKNKGILQTFRLPERDVEEGIAEIGPLCLVPAAERRVKGVRGGDYQHIRLRETWDEDS